LNHGQHNYNDSEGVVDAMPKKVNGTAYHVNAKDDVDAVVEYGVREVKWFLILCVVLLYLNQWEQWEQKQIALQGEKGAKDPYKKINCYIFKFFNLNFQDDKRY